MTDNELTTTRETSPIARRRHLGGVRTLTAANDVITVRRDAALIVSTSNLIVDSRNFVRTE